MIRKAKKRVYYDRPEGPSFELSAASNRMERFTVSNRKYSSVSYDTSDETMFRTASGHDRDVRWLMSVAGAEDVRFCRAAFPIRCRTSGLSSAVNAIPVYALEFFKPQ